MDSVQLFHLYRKMFKTEEAVVFNSPEEATVYLTLLYYLVEEVEPATCKQFLGDLVVCLHKEICDSKTSRIDHFLSEDHYSRLSFVVNKLTSLDQSYFMPSEDITNLKVLLVLSGDLLQKKVFNYSILNNY